MKAMVYAAKKWGVFLSTRFQLYSKPAPDFPCAPDSVVIKKMVTAIFSKLT
jgi:hypothetical protein